MLYLGGIQLMYWIRLDAAKYDAKAYVEKNISQNFNSQELLLTASQFNSLQWLENNKEFVLNGQRYDIIGITYTSQGVKVNCYSDKEETEIANAFEHFAERLFNAHQQSNSNDTDIISKITKEYLPLKAATLQTRFTNQISFVTAKKFPLLQSPVSDIWHPPAIC
jgi:hypothetical protein